MLISILQTTTLLQTVISVVAVENKNYHTDDKININSTVALVELITITVKENKHPLSPSK